MGPSIAAVLLDVLSLVQAGFELKAIVDSVRAMESKGATPEAIHAYIKGLRDAALKDFGDALKK